MLRVVLDLCFGILHIHLHSEKQITATAPVDEICWILGMLRIYLPVMHCVMGQLTGLRI